MNPQTHPLGVAAAVGALGILSPSNREVKSKTTFHLC